MPLPESRPLNTLRRRAAAVLLAQGLAGAWAWTVGVGYLAEAGLVGRTAGALALGAVGWWGVQAGRRAWRARVRGLPARLAALDPALAEVSAAVERRGRARPGESEELAALQWERAETLLGSVRPASVEPLRRLVPWGALALAAALLPKGVGLQGGGPTDGDAALFAGDVSLRYSYPAYTGLLPVTLENTTGAIHGPPGTQVEVSVRSQVAAREATVELGEALSLRVDIRGDGHALRAVLPIQKGMSAWSLAVVSRRGELARRHFALEVDEDLAPSARWEGDEVEVRRGLDEPLDLSWEAADDYGVAQVWLELEGVEVPGSRQRARQRSASRAGRVILTPRQLGLSVGEEGRLTVVALDNDAVSGAKEGRALPMTVVVSEAGPVGERLVRLERLRGLLLDALAGHLVEAWPLSASREGVRSWGGQLAGRYLALEGWERSSDPLEGEVLELVWVRVRALAAAAATSGAPGQGGALGEPELAQLDALREDAVGALEDGSLLLDRALRAAALTALQGQVGELRAAATALRLVGDDPVAVASASARLDARLSTLEELSGALPRGGLGGLVAGRAVELRRLMAGSADLLVAADQLEQLADAIEEDFQRVREEEEALAQAVEGLMAQLLTLEDTQRQALAHLREALPPSPEVEEAWEGLTEQARAVESIARERRDAVTEGRRQESTRALAEGAARLERAATYRDLERVRDEGSEVGRQLSWERWWAERDLAPSTAPLEDAFDALERRRGEVERAMQAAESAERWRARGQAAAERQVRDSLGPVRAQAAEVARTLPIRPRGLEPSLALAGEHMGRAIRELEAGKGWSGEGAEGSAVAEVVQAREDLERVLEQLAATSTGSGQGQEGGSGGGDRPSTAPFDFPEPDGFISPEAYRRAILDALASPVPEEQEEARRRYFEELARW